MDEVLSLIRSQVAALTAESQFRNWLQSKSPAETCEITFNNSYIYRQNLKTNKNDLYLGCTFIGQSVVDITVYSGFSRNKDFNILSPKANNVVLTEFTRTSTMKVSRGFWQKNLEVMKQTRNLFRNTGNALRLLHRLML